MSMTADQPALGKINILGYEVLNEPADRVAVSVCDRLATGPASSFVFLNPHSVVLAERDAALHAAITGASGVFCDGVGLAMASLVLNRKRVQRVYGYEFFRALSRELSDRGMGRVFFLGGQTEALKELITKYRAEYPGIAHVEAYAPPFQPAFTDADIAEMAQRVDAHGSDVLWIGLGSPKQEKILHQLLQSCNVRCAAAIGAVFDFYTNRVRHAPPWIRRLGLQWAHRLALEPTRLWRRTLISVPLFVSRIFLELAHSRKN